MTRERDTQRSRVYGWERAVARLERRDFYAMDWERLDQVQAWLDPIWRAERGRYGKGRWPAPEIRRPAWGQWSALAHQHAHAITLPRHYRNPWVALHEMAHLLIPPHQAPHGARFVGVLIGIAARHLEYDADELMLTADEHGVRYNRTSIGRVPERGIRWRALKALSIEGPMTPADLACWLSIGTAGAAVSQLQVRGAMIGAIASGHARLAWGKYRLTGTTT